MTNSKDIVIKLQDVSKKYKLFNSKSARLKEALHPLKKKYHKEFYALNNINLEVARGEILGIMGVNGSGKSTLLKIISGIIPPTSGKLNVKGRIIPLLELGSGLNPEFTGLENIYFYNRLNGFTHKQTDAVLDEILDFAEIGEFIYQPLKTYSSGMKARLAFALSVNIDPDILILDEVLSVGDELFRRKCYARMEEIFKAGKTILFVSHNAQSINQLCTSAILLDSGECILKGPTNLITTNYQNYLFTRKEERLAFRNKMIALSQNRELKADSIQDNVNNETEKNEKEPQRKQEQVLELATADNAATDKPYLIPNFKPKTTKVVKNENMLFHGAEITTLENKKVNVLLLDEEYILRYKFTFNFDAQDIFFAYTINNEKGLKLANCNTRANTLEKVHAGECYSISWHFRCSLMPGTYYFGIGTGCQFKNEVFMQISDALVFKIISTKKLTYSGLVYLYKNPIIDQIQ